MRTLLLNCIFAPGRMRFEQHGVYCGPGGGTKMCVCVDGKPELDVNDVLPSIVRVYAQTAFPNLAMPWQVGVSVAGFGRSSRAAYIHACLSVSYRHVPATSNGPFATSPLQAIRGRQR